MILTASHKSWSVVSSISFISKYFLILWFLLSAIGYLGVCYNIFPYLWFSQILLLCGQRTLCLILILLQSNFLSPCWPSPCSTCYWKWDIIQLLLAKCILLPSFLSVCFPVFWNSVCTCVFNYFVFLIDWPFCHYKMFLYL